MEDGGEGGGGWMVAPPFLLEFVEFFFSFSRVWPKLTIPIPPLKLHTMRVWWFHGREKGGGGEKGFSVCFFRGDFEPFYFFSSSSSF